MVEIDDYDIKLIEQEILWKYEDPRYDHSDYDCLLSLRKKMKDLVLTGKQLKKIWWIPAFCPNKFGGTIFIVYICTKNVSNGRRCDLFQKKDVRYDAQVEI